MNPFLFAGSADSHFWAGRQLILQGDEPLAILTLWQPWATLIAVGLKRFETRGWSTPFRGKLAIHAAVKWDAENLEHVRYWSLELARAGVNADQLPRGAIVALTTVEDMHRTVSLEPTLDRREVMAGDYSRGRWAWRLGDVERFLHPPRWKGSQGLRMADRELREIIGTALVDNVRRPR